MAPQRKIGVLLPGEGGSDPLSITDLLHITGPYISFPVLSHMVDLSQRECEGVLV